MADATADRVHTDGWPAFETRGAAAFLLGGLFVVVDAAVVGANGRLQRGLATSDSITAGRGR